MSAALPLLLAALAGAETLALRGPLLSYKGRWGPTAAPHSAQTVLVDGPAWLTGASAEAVGEDGRPVDVLGTAVLAYGRVDSPEAPRVFFPPDGTLALPEGFGVRLRPGELYLFRARLRPASPPAAGRARVEARLALRRPADGPEPAELAHFSRWFLSDAGAGPSGPSVLESPAGGSVIKRTLVVPAGGRLHAANAFSSIPAASYRLRLRRSGLTLFDGPQGEYASAEGAPVERGDVLECEARFENAAPARMLAGVNLFIRRDDPGESALGERPEAAAYEPSRDDPHAHHAHPR
jgi:hypothetical protein